MSSATVAIAEAAGVISEESHRIAALGPVLTRGQLEASCQHIRFALAKLQSYAPLLPVEHPKAPLEAPVKAGAWP